MSFLYKDATELAQLVRDREVTPVELLDSVLERIDEVNKQLNAIVTRMDDEARAQVANNDFDGPFAGVPFLLKEFAAVAGVRTTSGSRLLEDYISPGDSELVRRYRAAGLVFAGKTNVPEFGILGTTESLLFGPARNPWDVGRTTGGSSGGSAAAVAAGLVPVAHASDGGGSIRIPASCCGVFGLKPTRARNPQAPGAADAGGLTCEHVVSRSVRDNAAFLDLTAGPYAGAGLVPLPERPFATYVDDDLPPLRIGLSTTSPLGFATHPDCVRAVEDAAALCESLGHHVEEAAPAFDGAALWDAFDCVWTSEIATWVGAAFERRDGEIDLELIEPLSRAMREVGLTHTAAEFQAALEQFRIAAWRASEFHETYDLWLTPTLALPPVELGWFDQPEDDPLRAYRRDSEFCAFTPIANATGQPAISVPLWWNDDDLPVGVHFTAPIGGEPLLFAVAGQLERARPWARRRPPYGLADDRVLEEAH